MASQRRYKSTAVVLQSVFADSASEDSHSGDLSSEYNRSQSPGESFAGSDHDVSESPSAKRKVWRTEVTVVDGGWIDNNNQYNVDALPFTSTSGCTTPLQSHDPLAFSEQLATSDFVTDCVTETNGYASDYWQSWTFSFLSCSQLTSWAESTVSVSGLWFSSAVCWSVFSTASLGEVMMLPELMWLSQHLQIDMCFAAIPAVLNKIARNQCVFILLIKLVC